ncbi:MAG: hypothetical protein H6573_03030 [Lewinellaceae bacterium]|nr:hypothetical protein [Phaeodactylibacter sp.]MCB9346467.1 hypothetical protein [Lewinellaceae bacterium]
MKPLVIFLAFSLVAWNSVQAQISEQIKKMSQGANNALMLEIPNTDSKLAGEVWKDYMKSFYDTKPKWERKADEWFCDNAEITAIGRGNTIDIYASSEEKGNDVLFSVWFDLGGAYLSSREHTDPYLEAEKLMMRFALEVAQEKTRRELNAENDQLKKLQRDLDRLKSLNDRYHKDIERAEEAIKNAQQNIVDNQKMQEDMLRQITEQEKLIEGVQKRLNDL